MHFIKEKQKLDMELCDGETRARKQKQIQATEQFQWSEEVSFKVTQVSNQM